MKLNRTMNSGLYQSAKAYRGRPVKLPATGHYWPVFDQKGRIIPGSEDRRLVDKMAQATQWLAEGIKKHGHGGL